MAKVEMYTKMFCPYCTRAKKLFAGKGVEFEEIDIDSDPRLDELYGADVPVLQSADGKELCRHRLTPEAIRRLS